MDKNLILLHGWASKVNRWSKFEQEMKTRGWQVFLPLLPGFGSTKLARPWDLDDYCHWLADYVKRNKIGEYCLLGHSFGGSVALKFASQKPSGLKKLVVVNSAGIRRKLGFKKIFFCILAKTGKVFFIIPPFYFLKSFCQRLLYWIIRERDYLQADPLVKLTMKRILKQDLKHSLKEIKIATLLIWGNKDKVTPLKDGIIINKEIANSRLIVYDGVGHDLPFKKWKKMAGEIVAFCKNDIS